jgi:putative ABC transport system permease protein
MRVFFFLLFRVSLRHLRRQRVRTFAALFAIALGASVFSSVRMAIDGAGEAFSASMDRITGLAEFHITSGAEGVPEGLVASLVHHPDVRAAAPFSVVHVQARRQETGEEPPFLLMGLDPFLDPPFRAWRPDGEAGGGIAELVTHPGALLLTESLAHRLNLEPGDAFTILHGGRPARVFVAGILVDEGLALAEGGGLALGDLATFQESTGRIGVVDRVDLILRPGAAIHRIQALLSPDLTLKPASDFRNTGLAMVRAYRMNLLVMGFVSLFVGMFLVYSVVALNAASRSGEVAMLRALGVSRSRVFLLFLTEGLMLGLWGWLFSLPLTLLAYPFLQEGVGGTLSTLFWGSRAGAAFAFRFQDFFLTLGLTLLVSALAALQPALQAMGLSPKGVLAVSDILGGGEKKQARSLMLGLALWVLVPFFSRLPTFWGLPLGAYLAAFSLFGGTALFMPWFFARMGPGLARILGRGFGPSAFLAGRQFRESGGRIALAAGSLTTAVALFVALSVMVTSFRETVRTWVEQSIGGDLFVRPRMAEWNGYRYSLGSEVKNRLEGLDGWDLLSYRRIHLEQGGLAFDLEAMDLEVLFRHGDFLAVSGDPRTVLSTRDEGPLGLLVSEPGLHLHGLAPGMRLEFVVDGKPVLFEIKAVVRDFRTRTLALFCDREALSRKTGRDIISGVRLFAKKERNLNARALEAETGGLQSRLLADFGDEIEVADGLFLRKRILKIFDETFAITFVLLSMALAIAGLGVATTLTLRVMAGKVGFVTLKALGASRSQIRGMVRWEASLLLIFCLLAGLGCGAVLSWLLIHGVNRQSFGWTFIVSLDVQGLIFGLGLIAGAGFLAAGPAIAVALKARPADALREGNG